MTGAARVNCSKQLTYALALANQGLPCFPCHEDKRPATPRGFKDATRHHRSLRQLWSDYPGPLIGVPTGDVTGLDVLDIDARHRGASWFAEHRNRLPITRVHRTRSGGLHLVFRHDPSLRCGAGKIAAGIDVRASGGYVIWWPAAGLPVLCEVSTAAWPDWLRALLLPGPCATTSRIRVPDGHSISRLVRLVAAARLGERNSLTYWAACRAGEMVASGLLEAPAAAAIIVEAATRTGLSQSEAQHTTWSGIRTTRGSPRA